MSGTAIYHRTIKVLVTNYRHLSVVIVAQLVEPRIVIPVVVGSSPIGHPNFIYANIDCILGSENQTHDLTFISSKAYEVKKPCPPLTCQALNPQKRHN